MLLLGNLPPNLSRCYLNGLRGLTFSFPESITYLHLQNIILQDYPPNLTHFIGAFGISSPLPSLIYLELHNCESAFDDYLPPFLHTFIVSGDPLHQIKVFPPSLTHINVGLQSST